MTSPVQAQEWAQIAITGVAMIGPLVVMIKARRAQRQLGPIFLLSLIMTTGLTFLLEFLWYALSPVFIHPPVLISDHEAEKSVLFFAYLSLVMNALLFGLGALMRKRRRSKSP